MATSGAYSRQTEACCQEESNPSRRGGGFEVREALPVPRTELFMTDRIPALDRSVLLRPPEPDVPLLDPERLAPGHKGGGERLPVIALPPLHGEWEGPLELCEGGRARPGRRSGRPSSKSFVWRGSRFQVGRRSGRPMGLPTASRTQNQTEAMIKGGRGGSVHWRSFPRWDN